MMALPIAPTPYLMGQDAENFQRKIEEGLKNPALYTPTPKLDQAIKIIKKYTNYKKGDSKI